MQKHVITEWYIENARGQKRNARSVRNASVQHAAHVVAHTINAGATNAPNKEGSALYVFPVDADGEQREKKELVKNLKHANIAYSTAAPSGEGPSTIISLSDPSDSSSVSTTSMPSICYFSIVCHVLVGTQGFHLS